MDELKKLNQLFNLDQPILDKSPVREVVVEDESVDKKEADFDLARRTYRSLIERNDEAPRGPDQMMLRWQTTRRPHRGRTP